MGHEKGFDAEVIFFDQAHPHQTSPIIAAIMGEAGGGERYFKSNKDCGARDQPSG